MSSTGPEREDEAATFQVPLPPPPFPPDRDVIFFARGVADREARDTEDIMLRSVPRPVAQRFRAAAGGRGLTHAQYLAALVALHEAMRQRADSGNSELAAELEQLRLSTVSI